MKRRTFLALGLTAVLSLPFAMSAFADDAQYTVGQDVEFSGQTDFGYFFTYTAGGVNAKCFSVVSGNQRWYAAVHVNKYEYCRNAFANQTVTFKGKFQRFADDGNPVILISAKLITDEQGQKSISLADCMWQANCGDVYHPNFKAFYECYDAGDMTVPEDCSYLMIDTNPLNTSKDSFFTFIYEDSAFAHIKQMNSFLALPDWLFQEMEQTRAIDGRQKEVFDNVTVTWSYHPNQGLEVMYRANQ